MKIQIMDTTLRDGEQTPGVSFGKDEKLAIAKSLLLDVNVSAIEIASARVSEGELQTASALCSWAAANSFIERIEILGFVDSYRSVEWIRNAGCRSMNLLCKGSLAHLTHQLRKSPEEHVQDINMNIRCAKEKGVSCNVYLEDVSNGFFHSKDYVFFLLQNIKGAHRIMIADTLGILHPEEAFAMCREITSKFPGDYYDFHAHNDYHLAVANTLFALKAGVTRIHTTLNGLGERAGNCSLASIVACMNDHTQFRTEVREKNLTAAARLVESLSGIRLSSNAPVTGENVYTQTCGVHADGDKKANLYSNKLTPERFGGQKAYALGKTSGKASIEKNLELLGIELDEESVKKVAQRIVSLGDQKERITISDLPYIVSDVLGTPVQEKVKILSYSLSVDSKSKPLATVKLSVDGKTYEESSEGDGQYDAFMKSIKRIFERIGRKLPSLVDYSVSIPPGGRTDALVETIITWQDGRLFKTRGVDPDQITAAIKATLNMLNQT